VLFIRAVGVQSVSPTIEGLEAANWDTQVPPPTSDQQRTANEHLYIGKRIFTYL